MIGNVLNLQILLHSYCSPTPFRNQEAPAVREGIAFLFQEKMIEHTEKSSVFAVTDKGEAYIRHIMCIPFPRSVWMIPSLTTETPK